MIIVDDLPTLPHPRSNSVVSHRPYGVSAIITGDEFIARICLETGNVIWFHERSRKLPPEAVQKLPRRIFVSHFNTRTLWVSDRHDVVAEIMAADDGGLSVCVYSFKTGKPIWERHRPLPKAKAKAKGRKKSSQFYPPEFCAFVAADPERLIVCVLGGQLDVIRIDPSSGDVVYDKSHPDAHVGIVERRNFTGAWTRMSRLGIIDFETGENLILMEHSESFTRHFFHSGDRIIASWHSKSEFGIVWMTADGTVQQQASFSRKKTNDTAIHLTSAGLALQINDQKLLWFGDSNSPQWEALCKPYIYNVHGFPGTDIFVGTDGRGGRLFSFDQQTGEEKLNLKSEGGGGMADLEYLETYQSLAFSFGATRTQAGLMILSVSDNNQKFISTDTHDRRARLACLGFWRHGAVYRVGRNLEQLGILDLRKIEPST